MPMKWTPKDDAALIAAVRRSSNVAQAVDTARDALRGKRVTYDAMANRLKRLGQPPLSELLSRPTIENNAPARVRTEELTHLDEHKLKVQLREQRARAESLAKDLVLAKGAIDAYAQATAAPLPRIQRRELGSGLREACAVALLSDAHVEERVLAGDTPVGNTYNLEIAERSVGRFFAALRWKLGLYRQAFKIRSLVCWLGGDLMTGHIHAENVETTAGTPLETMLWLRPWLISGIDSLLEDNELQEIYLPCSYGNHGRNTHKPYRVRGAAHSYEWTLYQFIAEHYKNEPRVRFLADASAHQYVHVYDFDLHFHHGDETSYNGGVGGITIPLNKAASAWDVAKRCHYHHFGHWHQYQDTGNIVVNGSVIGFNGYAMSIKAKPEDPQQAFYLLDSKRGKTCKSPLWVRDSADLRAA